MESIFIFINKVVASGGGSAAIAFCLFRFFGQKWIEHKFAQNLEQINAPFIISDFTVPPIITEDVVAPFNRTLDFL